MVESPRAEGDESTRAEGAESPRAESRIADGAGPAEARDMGLQVCDTGQIMGGCLREEEVRRKRGEEEEEEKEEKSFQHHK